MTHYFQGLIMGLAYVAPIGMQNLFILNTALTQKKSRVFLTAFIIIFFDVTLAFACFFGLGAIMEHSLLIQKVVLFFGSLIVIWIGYGIIRSKVKLDTKTDVSISLLKVISTACVVTWFNPQAIIDGSMMLGAFRATLTSSESLPFILGVSSGSVLWFLSLATFIPMMKKQFNPKILSWINVVCGIVIVFYGLKLSYDFIKLVS